MLDEDGGDRTATVVVPDRQLSLAIGKEGQNARLAAKLTNWRIDIKSITEAATEALQKAGEQEEIHQATAKDHDILAIANEILKEKEGAELSDGEAQALSRAVEIVRTAEVAMQKEQAAARLREAIAQALVADKPSAPRPKAETDADLLSRAEAILAAKTSSELDEGEAEELKAIEAAIAEMEGALEGEETEEPQAVAEDAPPVLTQPAAADAEAEAEPEMMATEVEEPVAAEAQEETEPKAETEVDAEATEDIQTLEQETQEKAEPVEGKEPATEPQPGEPEMTAKWVINEDEDEEDDAFEGRSKRKGRSKKRQLVFDEKLGEVVSHRRRKPGRQQKDWEDYY